MDLIRDESSAPLRRVQPPRRRLAWPLDLYQSAVGKKWVMALSGLVLMGYVFAHMVGNLKMYLGAEELNHYAEWLREMLEPVLPRTGALWLMRGLLIAAFALHIHSAYSLTRMNHRSRPSRYASNREYVAANFASRTMRWTGVIVGLFVVFHLMDLTWGNANPDFVQGEPYHNLVESFSRLPVAAVYVIANVALAIHLYHGAWSLFASLGVSHPRIEKWQRRFAVGFAALVLLGNVSFPVMVQAGVVG